MHIWFVDRVEDTHYTDGTYKERRIHIYVSGKKSSPQMGCTVNIVEDTVDGVHLDRRIPAQIIQ
jgi:hypothetical protein